MIYDLTALNAESAEQMALLHFIAFDQTLSQKERGWPRETRSKVKSKGQHPFPGEVKRSWCFCSFSQMVKTESKVKIPSA